MSRFLILSFVFVLVLGNIILFLNTENKISQYNENPPFIKLDHTHSARFSQESKVSNLFDGKKETHWKKLRDAKDWDLDLELKLTHVLKQGIYEPREFFGIELHNCGKETDFWKWEVYLREAINVDKELRLPSDKVLLVDDFQSLGRSILIPIPSQNLQPTEGYNSKEIYILGIRLKAKELGSCLAEIVLKK